MIYVTKDLFIIFFVIICSIQIWCKNVNSDLSNESLEVDNSDSEELDRNLKVDSASAQVTDKPKTYTVKCPCEPANDCSSTCSQDDDKEFQEMVLITITEVVIGTAIVMGVSALVTVLLKVCTRRRYTRDSLAVANNSDGLGRTDVRISLSSLQQRVMTKLRDRPPRYETRHNYEYQRRERSTRIAVLNPMAAIQSNSIDIPPPAYENNDINSIHDSPPAYTISVEDSGGIVNQSFTSNECMTNSTTENPSCDIDGSNRRCDNVLHI